MRELFADFHSGNVSLSVHRSSADEELAPDITISLTLHVNTFVSFAVE